MRQILGRLFAESLGARGRTPRRPGAPVVEYDAAAGGFVERPASIHMTVWDDALNARVEVRAYWNGVEYVPDVHGTCTDPAKSGGSGRSPAWSPADEARVLLQRNPAKPKESA